MSKLATVLKDSNLSDSLKLKILKNPLNTIVSQEDKIKKVRQKIIHPKTFLPESFNGKEHWKEFLSPVFNQGNCGSCWAFSTTSTLAARFNILTNLTNLVLSPTMLIICDVDEVDVVDNSATHPYFDFHPELEQSIRKVIYDTKTYQKESACFGNSLSQTWENLYLYGTVKLDCLPYDYDGPDIQYSLTNFQEGDVLPACQNVTGPYVDLCIDQKTPARQWRCQTYYIVPATSDEDGSIDNMKTEIYTYGPVTSGFDVYPDFYEFNSKKEIYEWNGQGPKVGGHAVEIVGWGQENNKDFWWIKNTWGESWGIDGYFKMIRGNNNCNIETNVIAGIPDIFSHEKIEIPYIKGSLPPQIVLRRKELDLGVPGSSEGKDNINNAFGGGIDPETGYYRKTMAENMGYDFSINLELPDLDSSYAGDVESKSIPKPVVQDKYTVIYVLLGLICFEIFITIILILDSKVKLF